IVFALLLINCPGTFAQKNETVTGYVFIDNNQNGIKDGNEEGIKNVAVSDQVNVVTTDVNGFYQLSNSGYGIVFISLPDGYTTKNFWQKANSNLSFALTKTKPVTSFSFIQASDTHISEKSLERMNRFRALVDSVNPSLVLITGDLVRDALRVSEKEATGYYDLFKNEIQKVKQPVWLVPGNHEIFGIERHLSLVSSKNPLYGRNMYRSYFGPDYYSFNYGGVHFIALNSLEFEDLWYYGSIDSVQLEWLKKDIALLSPSTPVVTFQHVPFFTGGMSISPYEPDGPGRTLEKEKGVIKFRHIVTNAQDVLAILKDRNYPLALAGHYHYQQKFSLEGVQTRFEQTAAVIGPSEEGVIKMPSGITLYKVINGKIDEGIFIWMDK
ncbi:MAG: metallophosphoesterase, partial [Sphingobacteriales bacterium]|nr:metallophosphoesterase [Sphingobacteriales bacterium]